MQPAPPRTIVDDTARNVRVRYWPSFLTRERAAAALAELVRDVPWEQEQVVIYGEQRKAARLTATYGDHAALTYGYAGVRKGALSWTPLLRELRDEIAA